MKTKRLLALVLSVLMLAALLAACSGSSSSTAPAASTPAGSTAEPAASTPAASGAGSVYYLNFKPEQDQQWQDLAALYTEQTGVPVTVLTAASGQYETTLKSEIAKSDAPTLFQVNGPVGLASWKDYCYDLSGSQLFGELTSEEFALMNGSEVAGIAYVIETYGIIYNKALLEQAGYTQDDIKGFADLQKVAEDITARSDELGFFAFTSAGMDGSSDWRYTTHLANLPIYYEYRERGIEFSDAVDAIEGLYLDDYKAIWDLYINNSTTSLALLSTKTGDDAVAEFVTEQAVFYQNGSWAYGDVADLGDDNLGMLPIYIGVEGEENQGLCTGTENYWCVNKNASEDDIQATMDFLYWCVTSEEGTKSMCEDMGFVIPFKGNLPAANPLGSIANDYAAEGYEPVAWVFSNIPSEEWKKDLGSALTAYAAGTGDWDGVTTAFVDGWATEYELVNGPAADTAEADAPSEAESMAESSAESMAESTSAAA